jgi:cell division inhibitor SulA
LRLLHSSCILKDCILGLLNILVVSTSWAIRCLDCTCLSHWWVSRSTVCLRTVLRLWLLDDLRTICSVCRQLLFRCRTYIYHLLISSATVSLCWDHEGAPLGRVHVGETENVHAELWWVFEILF